MSASQDITLFSDRQDRRKASCPWPCHIFHIKSNNCCGEVAARTDWNISDYKIWREQAFSCHQHLFCADIRTLQVQWHWSGNWIEHYKASDIFLVVFIILVYIKRDLTGPEYSVLFTTSIMEMDTLTASTTVNKINAKSGRKKWCQTGSNYSLILMIRGQIS